jgi:hypothetical protein
MAQTNIDDIIAEVQRQSTIAAGAKSLLEQLYAMRNDPVKLQATLDTLRSNDAMLADAITANTPAAA